MKPNSNLLSLAKLWIPALLLLLVYGAIASLAAGEIPRQSLPRILLFVLAAVVIGMVTWQYNQGLVGRMLQKETPADLVAYFERTLRTAPDAGAHIAYNTGLVYALYGNFAQARARLGSVNWESQPPHIRGMGLALEALLDYLDTRDYRHGLELVRRGRRWSPVFRPACRAAARRSRAIPFMVMSGKSSAARSVFMIGRERCRNWPPCCPRCRPWSKSWRPGSWPRPTTTPTGRTRRRNQYQNTHV